MYIHETFSHLLCIVYICVQSDLKYIVLEVNRQCLVQTSCVVNDTS